MIARFSSLKGLGVFLDYVHAADVPDMRQHNLIYGFNGSGKTTLSRIFASLAAGARTPLLPPDGTFEIELQDGTRIKSSGSLDALKGRLLVFNVDFVEDHVKWKDGTADPVVYIGKPQADTAEKLEKIQAELKSLAANKDALQKEADKAANDFTVWKRDNARDIAGYIGQRNYAAPALIKDYEAREYTDKDVLAPETVTALQGTLGMQAALPTQPELSTLPIGLAAPVTKTRELLGTTLGELAVAELRAHPLMAPWVKQGLAYHMQHKVADCLFCGNKLTEERLGTLSKALDDRLDKLNADLASTKRAATGIRDRLAGIKPPSKHQVAAEFQAEVDPLLNALTVKLTEAATCAGSAIELLDNKIQSLNSKIKDDALMSDAKAAELDASISELSKQVNSVLARHNESVAKFEEGKEAARTKLKTHHLARQRGSYAHMNREARDKKTAQDAAALKHAELQKQADDLQRDVRTHGEAEKIINALVQGYLGHKELQLRTHQSGYHILRNGKPANLLSEGEKTAFALCYFLSTLQAENRDKKNLVVVVDDPISSLDTRALHHAFGLIKSALRGSGQLIVMTHNLHFMNEVKKWLKKDADDKQGKAPTASLLYLEAKQDSGTGTRTARLMKMPRLIREYESEYQLLFNLTLRFIAGEQDFHYLMPNALRKVLEIFLAFKQPGSSGLDEKIKAMTDEVNFPEEKIIALQRLVHLESHADSLDDLINLSPMSVESTKQTAEALVELMKAADPKHHDRLTRICRIEKPAPASAPTPL